MVYRQRLNLNAEPTGPTLRFSNPSADFQPDSQEESGFYTSQFQGSGIKVDDASQVPGHLAFDLPSIDAEGTYRLSVGQSIGELSWAMGGTRSVSGSQVCAWGCIELGVC